MNEQHDYNRARWNEVTPVHVRSEFYNVEDFLRGGSALDDIERDGLGDVRGKSIVHLQCHFGLSTLDMARQGAQVVGVDFSETAIAAARELATRTGLSESCRFVCADVLDLEPHGSERFDIVFTSYGVLTWLCDLDKWAATVARLLKPQGRFFIAEIHPASLIFEDRVPLLRVKYDYFHEPQGIFVSPGLDYADNNFTPQHGEYYWAWPLAHIFGALEKAKLRVFNFREYPFAWHQQFAHMTREADGHWHLPRNEPKVPLLFSLHAKLEDSGRVTRG